LIVKPSGLNRAKIFSFVFLFNHAFKLATETMVRWYDLYPTPPTLYTRSTAASAGIGDRFSHWISPLPAKPIARLQVGPEDFPFLAQIHGHNDEKLVKLYASSPQVFPLDALED
jgi:hypothetical protein